MPRPPLFRSLTIFDIDIKNPSHASPNKENPRLFQRKTQIHMPQKTSANWLFCIPSFWGLLAWTSTSALYIFGPLDWNPISATGYMLLLSMALAFLISIVFHAPLYKKAVNSPNRALPNSNINTLIALHLVGLLGSLIFAYDITAVYNQSFSFIEAFFQDPLSIRKASLDASPRGVYLAYFGWLASLLTGARLATKTNHRILLATLLLLQFASELVFMNKTRPLAVLILACFGYLFATRKAITLGTASRYLLLIGGAFCIFFVAWSASTGKVWSQGTSLPPALETLVLYLTAGYPYLLHIIETEPGGDFASMRVIRPILTLSAILLGTPPPPSAILPFYELPYATNVGTALEPFFRDGGTLGLCIGFVILSAGVDYLSLTAIRHGRTFGLCLSTTLCLTSASTFFVSKINTGSVALATTLFLISIIFTNLAMPFRNPKTRSN